MRAYSLRSWTSKGPVTPRSLSLCKGVQIKGEFLPNVCQFPYKDLQSPCNCHCICLHLVVRLRPVLSGENEQIGFTPRLLLFPSCDLKIRVSAVLSRRPSRNLGWFRITGTSGNTQAVETISRKFLESTTNQVQNKPRAVCTWLYISVWNSTGSKRKVEAATGLEPVNGEECTVLSVISR